jgi:hypothetical protein
VVSFIGSTRFVDEFEIKFGHLWQIAHDTVANFLQVSIVLQVRVVHKDANLMWGSHQEVTPSE